jgi:hypothetical protein
MKKIVGLGECTIKISSKALLSGSSGYEARKKSLSLESVRSRIL